MFLNIIGHEKAKAILENSLKNKSISHAYLFYGRKGLGKLSLAKEFAKKILNTDNLESFPDYKYISKKDDKKDIIIEQIRKELIDDIYISPAAGEYKVYIIDDAENLNTASQNALLKTLEEPPKYIVIILVSSNISIFLPTIISRVNKISFNGINKEQINDYIIKNKNVHFNENVLGYIDGSIGLATKIIDTGLLEKFNEVDKLYEYIRSKDLVNSMNIASDIDFLYEYLLDYLEHIIYIDKKYECIKFIEKAKQRLKFNGNYDIVIDNMILKIMYNLI
jgi:DNA polymerase-3 subunit delta'